MKKVDNDWQKKNVFFFFGFYSFIATYLIKRTKTLIIIKQELAIVLVFLSLNSYASVHYLYSCKGRTYKFDCIGRGINNC